MTTDRRSTTKNTTMADVAREAEVSLSTVSNLLNGRTERMSSSTRDRVLRAIEELGYTPSQAARQLKTGDHPSVIGLMVPSVANPFYGALAHHVEAAALSKGYQVLLGNTQRDPDRERAYTEELWGYGVRGLIFGSSMAELSHLEKYVSRGLKIVALERPAEDGQGLEVDSIGIDNEFAGRLATKHLLSRGHRRIGFLSGPIRTIGRRNRLTGYQAALAEHGIEPDPDLIWDVGLKRDDYGDADALNLGRQGTQVLLSRPDPPTAVFAVNDMVAFGAYAGAKDLGLSVPRELSVIGIDNITLSQVVDPGLTTVSQPTEEIADLAVRRLIKRLRNGTEAVAQHELLRPQLILRSSTASIRNDQVVVPQATSSPAATYPKDSDVD